MIRASRHSHEVRVGTNILVTPIDYLNQDPISEFCPDFCLTEAREL